MFLSNMAAGPAWYAYIATKYVAVTDLFMRSQRKYRVGSSAKAGLSESASQAIESNLLISV
jgi:hypothetical protein